jgi:hypothetical protein
MYSKLTDFVDTFRCYPIIKNQAKVKRRQNHYNFTSTTKLSILLSKLSQTQELPIHCHYTLLKNSSESTGSKDSVHLTDSILD